MSDCAQGEALVKGVLGAIGAFHLGRGLVHNFLKDAGASHLALESNNEHDVQTVKFLLSSWGISMATLGSFELFIAYKFLPKDSIFRFALAMVLRRSLGSLIMDKFSKKAPPQPLPLDAAHVAVAGAAAIALLITYKKLM